MANFRGEDESSNDEDSAADDEDDDDELTTYEWSSSYDSPYNQMSSSPSEYERSRAGSLTIRIYPSGELATELNRKSKSHPSKVSWVSSTQYCVLRSSDLLARDIL
jgi:hypothetical protein